MPIKKQQDMGSGDPQQHTGGMGTSRNRPDGDRGGEHGEKRPTNADHDQKVAQNRARILDDEERDAARANEHATHGSKSSKNAQTADDVLGQTKGRKSDDPDRERNSGDIVSGKEHSQFPSTQAGYDDRSSTERPPDRPGDDLSDLDDERNDDLSNLDKDSDAPLK